MVTFSWKIMGSNILLKNCVGLVLLEILATVLFLLVLCYFATGLTTTVLLPCLLVFWATLWFLFILVLCLHFCLPCTIISGLRFCLCGILAFAFVSDRFNPCVLIC
ncbi:hypothetical protein V8G54_001822 [Vigna mungo]|uniref:Uncharacterized protein n=1 Tax=Vigna mungo TaxID=3915 RepID=A0AAQ3P852_VIGMU